MELMSSSSNLRPCQNLTSRYPKLLQAQRPSPHFRKVSCARLQEAPAEHAAREHVRIKSNEVYWDVIIWYATMDGKKNAHAKETLTLQMRGSGILHQHCLLSVSSHDLCGHSISCKHARECLHGYGVPGNGPRVGQSPCNFASTTMFLSSSSLTRALTAWYCMVNQMEFHHWSQNGHSSIRGSVWWFVTR